MHSPQCPKLDDVLVDFMGQDFVSKRDNCHKCIQAAILSSSAPLINLWAQLSEQQLSVEQGGFVSVEVLLATIQKSLVLVGNASNYVSQMRRDTIIDKLRAEKNPRSFFEGAQPLGMAGARAVAS